MSTTSRALAWDPTAPASLSLCPLPSLAKAPPTDDDETPNASSLDIFLSHDGTGCHEVETTCLLSLLDARDEWETSRKGDVATLSAAYRRALCECLMQLQRRDAADNDAEPGDNYESLALIYAMMHLTEIFLLPHESPSSSPRRDKLDGMPGSLTARTVRYLRLHHSSFDIRSPAVQTLLAMDQPEYFTIDRENNDGAKDDMRLDPLLAGPYPQPYYNLLWHLIQTGQLVSAWAVLTRHSSCRRANEEASSPQKPLSKEAEGWSALRALLLSAPLPGGRGEEDDSELVDFFPSEQEEDEEQEVEEADQGAYESLVEGISRSAYLLWEDRPREAERERKERYHRHLIRCGLDLPREEAEVLPETYSESIAMHVFQHWQRTVKSLLTPRVGRDHVLGALFSRFPQLQQILSLLGGSATTPALGTAANPSWSEVLLSELLYQRPNIPPADIAVRGCVAMRNRGGSNEVWEQMVLKVMEGNAGNVIYSMFEFGGGSGAALPATLTSLLCNLLIDAGCIALPSIQTELLLSAAESILSSFSVQGQADVGVRTAVRLLLLHSPPQRISGEVSYEPRIAATISEAISHRCPSTDAEASNLLNLTEDMIQRGSVRLADACESLAFCRASHHASMENWSRHVYWLLRGIEVMSVWLPEEYRRTLGFGCRRHFDALCEKSADELLTFLVATRCFPDDYGAEKVTEGTARAFRKSSTVLESVLRDDSMASVLKGHVEVNLLYHIVNVAVQQAKNDSTQAAVHIIHCLEERCMNDGPCGGGAVTTLANSDMYLRLLQIAVAILDEEERSTHGQMEFTTCAFSVHGIHILMARMTQVLFWEGVTVPNNTLNEGPKKSSDKANYFSAMRLILGKGLMRAFATNSGVDRAKEKGQVAKNVSLEEEVAMMLSPSF